MYQAKQNFVKRSIVGETLLVPVGTAIRDLNGMVLLNETGALLWDELQEPKDEEMLVQALLDAFEVDRETALAGVQDFIQSGVQNGLVLSL